MPLIGKWAIVGLTLAAATDVRATPVTLFDGHTVATIVRPDEPTAERLCPVG